MAWVQVAGVLTVAACGGGNGPTGPSGPPTVSSVNGATAPAGPIGSTVVIAGSGFGASQGSGQVLFSDGSGGTVPASIASSADWSGTLIVTAVPVGAGTGPLVVETSGGSSTPVTFTVTTKVAFSPSVVTWTSTASLPTPVSGPALASATLPGAVATPVVYAVGGSDSSSAPRSDVLVSTVSGTGALDGWSTTTPLPDPVSFAAAVVATPTNSVVQAPGMLYVLGGDSTAAGAPVARVYGASLAEDGSITGWTSENPLPAAVHSAGAVVFDGSIYVFGGSGAGNAPVSTVARAKIQSDGSLGSWRSLEGLPFPRSYFGWGINGTFLYVFGGDSAAVTPNDSSLSASALDQVVYAQIDVRTGDLTASGWKVSPNSLGKARSKHSAVVAGGTVLVSGGLYAGAATGSSEERYATLNPDGSTGSFNGAGSSSGFSSIQAAGGGNLFNQAAVGYADASGAFHVLVAGGDDVNDPTATKHAGVYYY